MPPPRVSSGNEGGACPRRPSAPPSRGDDAPRRRSRERRAGEEGAGRSTTGEVGGKYGTPYRGARGVPSGVSSRGNRGRGACGDRGCGVPNGCGTPAEPNAAEPNAGKRTRGVDGVQGVAPGFMPGRVGVGVNGTATASWWASRTSSSSLGVSSSPGSSRMRTSMAAASLDSRALGSDQGARCVPLCVAATRDTPRIGRETVTQRPETFRGFPRKSRAFVAD